MPILVIWVINNKRLEHSLSGGKLQLYKLFICRPQHEKEMKHKLVARAQRAGRGPLCDFKRAKPDRENLGKDGEGREKVGQWLLRKWEGMLKKYLGISWGAGKDSQEQIVPTRTRMALLGLDPSSERVRRTGGVLRTSIGGDDGVSGWGWRTHGQEGPPKRPQEKFKEGDEQLGKKEYQIVSEKKFKVPDRKVSKVRETWEFN